MASDKDDLIETIIVDSAGFLKNVQLQNIARNVYTVHEVISEIKSAAVREQLAVLPYEINFRLPSSESLHVVSAFAKKTGDFQSLSVVDLNVLALTYQLHKEKCGTDDLRKEPTKQVQVVNKQQQRTIPGFFLKTKEKSEDQKAQDKNDNVNNKLLSSEQLTNQLNECSLNKMNEKNSEIVTNENKLHEIKESMDQGDCDNKCVEVDEENERNDDDEDGQFDENKYQKNDDNCINDSNDDDDSEDNKHDCDDNDDDDDWISPSNISQIKADMGVVEFETKPTNVVVGCLTTDFAMQNVLLQMGLHVISIDGMLIKEARSYVLKCYSCFKVTPQMQRMFCPKCGNRTMVKVSVSVDEHGVTQYHMPKRNRPFNIRGKKHPLPLPKGGRHSNNPLLFEDQLITQKRLPKTTDKTNVFDEDYVTRSSPFAANDTTSRAFNLGFHMHRSNRRNPNEVQKKTRRKKK